MQQEVCIKSKVISFSSFKTYMCIIMTKQRAVKEVKKSS